MSSYQGNINWTNVSGAGITYAWAKATEGVGYIDPFFVQNVNDAKSVGIPIGPYHFAHPEDNTPEAEAQYFWNEAGQYIKGDGKTIMPMLDMEVFTNVVGATNYSDWVNQWCDAVVVYASGAGVSIKPVIYFSACKGGNFNGSISQWIPSVANYNGENAQTGTPWNECSGDDPWGSSYWLNWQYSSSGSVSGVTNAVDEDVVNGTSISSLLAGGVAIYYWDPQGTSGANPYTGNMSGNWDSSVWSVTSAGQSTPIAWAEGNAVCFGVHTGKGTPAFTVTMNETHDIAGFFDGPLNPDSCNVTLTGSGTINLAAGAQALDVLNASDGSLAYLTISNTIAGPGQLTPEGNGQAFLYGTNTYTGGTLLGYSGNGFYGILNFNNGSVFGTGPIIVSNTVYPSSCALVVSGTTSALVVTNPLTVLTNGSVNIVSTTAGLTFSGNWSLGHWILALGSGGAANNLTTISGVLSGSGSLTKFNPGILALTGANTLSGPVTNQAGTLSVNSIADSAPSALGTGSFTFTTNSSSTGGVLSFSGSATATTARQFSCTPGGTYGIDVPSGSLNINGRVTAAPNGNFTVNKTSAGTLTLGGSADNSYLGLNVKAGTVILNKTSSTSVHGIGSATTVSGGTLQLGGSGGYEIFSGVNLTVTSGVFDMNGQSDTFSSLTVSGTGLSGGGAFINSSVGAVSTLTAPVTLAANASLGGAGYLILASALSGAHVLTKVGPGTLTLNAANSFSGGTLINAGTIEGGVAGAVPGNVTNVGGILQLDNASAMASGATLALAAAPASGAVNLNFSGTQTVNALYFGSTQKAAGTWAASGATHNNAAFTGSGVLNVATGPASITTIMLTSGSNPSTYGNPLTFTATIAGNAPSGTVQFYVDGSPTGGPVPLSGGSASSPISTIPVSGSPHQVTASYSGDDNNNPSSTASGVAVTVNPAASNLALVSSQNPSQPGSNVTFTATVSSSAGAPVGNVVFSAAGAPFATNSLSAGVASAGTSALPLGTNTIAAQFADQGNFLGSSNTLYQIVSAVTLSQTNAILSISNNSDGTFTITVQGTPQAQYYLDTSSNLAIGGIIWVPLADSTNTAPQPSGIWSLVVSNPAPAFYRSVAISPGN